MPNPWTLLTKFAPWLTPFSFFVSYLIWFSKYYAVLGCVSLLNEDATKNCKEAFSAEGFFISGFLDPLFNSPSSAAITLVASSLTGCVIYWRNSMGKSARGYRSVFAIGILIVGGASTTTFTYALFRFEDLRQIEYIETGLFSPSEFAELEAARPGDDLSILYAALHGQDHRERTLTPDRTKLRSLTADQAGVVAHAAWGSLFLVSAYTLLSGFGTSDQTIRRYALGCVILAWGVNFAQWLWAADAYGRFAIATQVLQDKLDDAEPGGYPFVRPSVETDQIWLDAEGGGTVEVKNLWPIATGVDDLFVHIDSIAIPLMTDRVRGKFTHRRSAIEIPDLIQYLGCVKDGEVTVKIKVQDGPATSLPKLVTVIVAEAAGSCEE